MIFKSLHHLPNDTTHFPSQGTLFPFFHTWFFLFLGGGGRHWHLISVTCVIKDGSWLTHNSRDRQGQWIHKTCGLYYRGRFVLSEVHHHGHLCCAPTHVLDNRSTRIHTEASSWREIRPLPVSSWTLFRKDYYSGVWLGAICWSHWIVPLITHTKFINLKDSSVNEHQISATLFKAKQSVRHSPQPVIWLRFYDTSLIWISYLSGQLIFESHF